MTVHTKVKWRLYLWTLVHFQSVFIVSLLSNRNKIAEQTRNQRLLYSHDKNVHDTYEGYFDATKPANSDCKYIACKLIF